MEKEQMIFNAGVFASKWSAYTGSEVAVDLTDPKNNRHHTSKTELKEADK